MSNKTLLKNFSPIFLSLLFVLGCSFFAHAVDPAKMQFTTDAILSMEGTVSGDLIAVSGSQCDALDILGKNLTVTSIPVSSSFTLKTIKHTNALQVSPSGEKANLSFSTDNLINGEITSYALSGTSANVTWGVPKSNTRYNVKANSLIIASPVSDANNQISFSYDKLATPQTFTLELYEGGAAFIAPAKPNISQTSASSESGNVTLNNVPANVYQIAISRTPDFKDVSWEDFDSEQLKTIGNATETLYVKFRTKDGGVSDVIVYKGSTGSVSSQTLIDGDIVKTPDNPDVYIIKYKNNKQYKRLILSPSVFNSYQHLKWGNIKTISQEQLDQYVTSDLVKETTDTIIYQLFPNGDTGERRILDISTTYDADSVYEINAVDRDSYKSVK